ncbi:hypothetical protein [Olleya sp. HaHaR_3_96]|uniref:hypothetical protein n=1 Tax=Olleya sp. HaHaR_3_96 TaxID=2745560 RepID=UPI001C4FE735|nr:hypothetical protein [Olleya sp. HaHaR_3_96]QXP59477.1 hypothetical protein H0I26_16400 [Olleya sp. HaHaR_3_96]
MIKKKVLENIIQNKVPSIVLTKLEEHGFKYLKSQKTFKKTSDGIEYQLRLLTQQSTLEYIEESDEPRIYFSIAGSIKYIEYEKWYKKTFDEESRMNIGTNGIKVYLVPDISDFNSSSYYVPSKSQAFKSMVTKSLIIGKEEAELLNINEYIESGLFKLLDELNSKSNPEILFETREFPLQYTFLMHFYGHNKLAHSQIRKTYKYYLDTINKEENPKRVIQMFEKFLNDVRKLNGLELENPFKQAIKIKSNLNESRLNFLPNSGYSENLRIDIRNVDLNQVLLNINGEIILYINNSKLFILNSTGTLKSEITIPIQKGFDKLNWEIPLGYEKKHKVTYANNLLIFDDGTVIELEIPRQTKKSKHKQSSNFKDIKFIDNSIYVTYQKTLIKYSIEGEFVEQKEFREVLDKIITSKKWVISANRIFDFDGNLKYEYKVGHGNNKWKISNSEDSITFYGYSTKSQYYEFKGKSKTLWAHPTFKKGYKETLYSDTHHNFDLSTLTFSPDDSIMVGSGHHGKYVAWRKKSFERFELIPKDEVIALLEPSSKSIRKGDAFINIESKPEIIEIDNVKYLKNRSNSAGETFFIKKGEFFVFDIPSINLITVWNKDFQNIFYEKSNGRIEFYGQNQFTERNNDELIVFKRNGH